MERDTLYANTDDDAAQDAPFAFNEAVARVFPDMLQRSIPGYAASLAAIETLARQHVQPHSQCYDLGCSLGAAALAMSRGIAAAGCRIVAIDNAQAMIERCREILNTQSLATPIEVRLDDLREVAVTDASMVVMNYTLQFVSPEDRQELLTRIGAGIRERGILVLSEKIVHPNPAIERARCDLHHEFKRQHAYSELEISRKRAAIENVLIPDTLETHRQRLQNAGFRHIGVWLQHFNFMSLLAIR